jgi:hypothetical protein
LIAATGLAQLWIADGRQIEATQLLAGTYSWFNEGRGIPALANAKRLLDSLAPASSGT